MISTDTFQPGARGRLGGPRPAPSSSERFRTWDEVFPFVCRFFDPLLTGRSPGMWLPDVEDWQGRNELEP